MAIALTKARQHEYVLLAERNQPEAQRTTWLFRPLPYALRIEAGMQRTSGELGPQAMAEVVNRTLRTCLVGWRNLRDAEGLEVAPVLVQDTLGGQPLQVLAWESLDRIDHEQRDELFQAAMGFQALTKADAVGLS